jgi:hypothetical protein
MTTAHAGGMLVIWNGLSAEAEAEYYRWHDGEHIPERLAVPGFRRGRRFAHLSRPREFLTVYETASVGTLASAPYLAQLARPTAWSQQMTARFRDMVRQVFRVATRAGRGEGGQVLAARLGPETAPRWAEAVGALAAAPGVVAAHLLEHDPEATRRIGGQADEARPWLLLVECGEAAMGEAALAAHVPAGVPGLRPEGYRLQISVDADPKPAA